MTEKTTIDRLADILIDTIGIGTERELIVADAPLQSSFDKNRQRIDQPFPDLELDSLDLIELALMIDEEFAIEMTDADVVSLSSATIGDVAALIDRKLAAKAA